MQLTKETQKIGIRQSPKAILRSLTLISLIFIAGCGGKTVVIPDSKKLIPHPTMEGYQCLSPGFLKEIMDEYAICLDK
jgi:hypothetical protein